MVQAPLSQLHIIGCFMEAEVVGVGCAIGAVVGEVVTISWKIARQAWRLSAKR